MILSSREDAALIVAMTGKWMGTPEEANQIEAIRSEIIAGTMKIVVLDLKKMEWANSYGIGVMAGMLSTAQQSQVKLALANVSADIKKVLDISFLSKILPIYPTIDKAIKALS